MDTALSDNFRIDQAKIDEFCRRWNVRELSIFGSALTQDFTLDSDVDVLVEFVSAYSLDMLIAMNDELEALFGRKVDLIVKKNIERDPNYLRREMILRSAQVIYGAR